MSAEVRPVGVDPAVDRAAFGLELLARTAALHGPTTDDYALADALLPNTSSDHVRVIFADLWAEFASARMQTGNDNEPEAGKHEGAAHTLAVEAVKLDRKTAYGAVLRQAAGYYENRRRPFTVVRADDLTPRR